MYTGVIIYVSPLHQIPDSKDKILSSHVDDFMLAVSGSSPSDVQSKLQQAVSQQTTLANKYQIKFSKSKTEISYFFLPNNIDRSSLTISINNITYTPQSSIRYLGVWLDNSLDCQTHIAHRIGPARDIIKKLARLTTNGRTLHPHSAIRAIKAAFIPKLLYGIELFWKDNKKIHHKLQVIINHAIRFALSAFRTTPIPALQVESNIPPVAVIIHQMQSRLAYRLLNLPYHHSLLSLFPPDIPRSLATPHNYSDHFISRDWKQNYKSLRQYSSTLNRIFSHLRLSIQPFCQYYPPQLDPSPPAINFATLIQFSISKNDKPTATTEHLNFLQHNIDNIIVYTDGSKGQSLGSAFVIYYKGNILCEH
jgi:hypothetical protein